MGAPAEHAALKRLGFTAVMSTDSNDSSEAAKSCGACELRHSDCICQPQWPLDAKIEVLVLRHALERYKASGSAKLIPLVVGNASIIDIGVRGQTAPSNVRSETTALLFPGGRPIAEFGRLDRLVVLDGTWSQARRMRYRLDALDGIPTVSVNAAPPVASLRAPRHRGELATAVAVAHALDALGQHAAAVELHRAFEALVGALRPSRESRRGQSK